MSHPPTYAYLVEWSERVLNYSPLSVDHHGLVKALVVCVGLENNNKNTHDTTHKSVTYIPAYSPSLPSLSCIRCVVSYLYRFILESNDKY